ncbi:protein translocase subunit YajC [Bacillus cereus G9241]|nr:protein translocase subunit YajC [Bacillus cereus G9241]
MNPGMMNIVMIVAMFAIFYFLLIRTATKTSKSSCSNAK